MTHDPLPPGERPPPASVLLVTDDTDLYGRVDAALPSPLELDCESTASDALDRFTDGDSPDCVVCPEQLPEADASDLLDRLDDERPDVPVVVLTDEAATDAISANADCCLPRPVVEAYPGLLVHEVSDTLDYHRPTELLAESGDRHRSLVEDVLDDAVVGVAIYDDEGTLVWANQEIGAMFGVEVAEFVGRQLEEVEAAVYEKFERPERFIEAYERARDGDEVELECHVLPGPDHPERWLVHRARPITSGIYDGGWVTTYSDVTGRKRREQMLTALHQSTRELMRATSRGAVAEGVVGAATDALDLSSVVVYVWDEDGNLLRPVEWSDDVDSAPGFDRPPVLDGPEWLGWQAFVDGESRLIDDLQAEDTPFDGADPFRSGLLVPIGEYGLLASGAERPGAYRESDLDFAETLAANATVAMERTDREQRLHALSERLEDRDEKLRRVNRVSRVVRRVDRGIVDASTRPEIEQAVCEVLADVDLFDFVWLGDRDAGDEPPYPRAWAGDVDSGFIDDICESLGSAGAPPVEVYETGEPRVVSNILTEDSESAWRREMLSHGFSSTVAVPLTYEEGVYGSLEVASERTDAFDEELVTVLEEVGERVASAIAAAVRKDALLGARHRTELEFELEDTQGCGLLFHLADELDTTVTLRGVVSDVGGSYLVYGSVEGVDPERVVEFLDDAVSANAARVVTEAADACLVETEVTDLGIMETVTRHGGTVRTIEATGTTSRLLVGVPSTVEVRSFVDTVSDRYPSATLVAQRETTDGDYRHEALPAEVGERLTDRQQNVLQAAYFGGYFEWPRERNGEELAAQFDIAPPTFHQHLREAMRKFFATVYEPRPPASEDS